MSRLKMKSIRELNENDLKDRVIQMRTELSKLEVENAVSYTHLTLPTSDLV